MDFKESATEALFSEHLYEQHLHLARRNMTMEYEEFLSSVFRRMIMLGFVCGTKLQFAKLDNELVHPMNPTVPTFVQQGQNESPYCFVCGQIMFLNLLEIMSFW